MLVGLAGYAGAGKDTVARCLVERGWRQDAFAAPLKAIALDSDPWIPRERVVPMSAALEVSKVEVHIERLSDIVGRSGWDEAKKIHLVRRYLQNLGAAVRKHLGEDVWVRALHARCLGAGWPSTVVTDVRYPNEAEWILRDRSVLIWVSRPGVGPVNDHPSDQGLVRPLCTHEIVNDGTPEELWAKVLEVVG